MESVKYPRTPHLPFSEKKGSDDISIDDSIFKGKRVIVMLKMDGENCTMNIEKTWARSLDSNANDEGRRWCERLRNTHIIPFLIRNGLENYRICGENLFYKHTVEYGKSNPLHSVFYAFSLWNGSTCMDWDLTRLAFEEMGLTWPTIIYDGIYDSKAILDAFESYKALHEGFVVRIAEEFKYEDTSKNIAKFVKSSFVIKDNVHWRSKKLIVNEFYDANGNSINPWNIW